MSAIVRWGLLIGLVLIVFDLAMNLAMRPMLAPLVANPTPEAMAGSAGPLLAISCLSLVLSVVLYLVAGNRAASETGRAVDGLLAGLLAGALSAVASLLVEAVYPVPQPQMPGATVPVAPTWMSIAIGLAVSLFIAALFSGLGAWWATRNREPVTV